MHSKRNYYGIYTAVFVVMAGIVYLPFWKSGKTFIWMVDGFEQHYKAMVYYSKWLRTVLHCVFVEHDLQIPAYSFSIGYGADVLTTLNYYIIGDPFGVIAVLFPEKYMGVCYSLLVLLRLYFSGVAFSMYCGYMRKQWTVGTLVGAFSYVFCGYVLFAAIRHPFFVNPMISYPLLLLGVERQIQEKRPHALILVTAIAALSNFYFLYMLAWMTGLYVICRMSAVFSPKQIGKALCEMGKLLGYAFVGVMMGSVILVPVVLTYLEDARVGVETACGILWSANHYKVLWQGLVSYRLGEAYNSLGFTGILFLLVVSYLRRKRTLPEERNFKWLFCLMALFLLFPWCAKVLNGFSYVTNRWIWAFSFVASYAAVLEWERFVESTVSEQKLFLTVILLYVMVAVFLRITITAAMKKNLLLAVLFLGMLYAGTRMPRLKRWISPVGCVLVMASIAVNADWAYSIKGEYDGRLFVSYEMLSQNYGGNEEKALQMAMKGEKEFFRYSGEGITYNRTLQNGMSSTQYFWSLSNSAVTEYLNEMAVSDNMGIHRYNGLDGRCILENLAGVKYYVCRRNKTEIVPCGYEKGMPEDEENQFEVYVSERALPMGYTYDKYMLRDEYDTLNAAQKQEMLANMVVLEQKADGYENGEFDGTSFEYDVAFMTENLQMEEGCVTVLNGGGALTANILAGEGIENYLYVEGLDYAAENGRIPESVSIQVCAAGTREIKKTLTYTTPEYRFYGDKHDFIVNLGVFEGEEVQISIRFEVPGRYLHDGMKIVGQPLEEALEALSERGSCVLENVDLHNENEAYATRRVTGTLHAVSDKLLLMSIPYSKGWTAYVDGVEVPVQRANTMFMMIPVRAGVHEIEWRYETPGKRAGILVSILGITVWGILAGAESVRFAKQKIRE